MSFLKIKMPAVLKLLVMAIIFAQMAIMVWHVFSDLKVKNEYFYINEHTILSDGSTVDNFQFENSYLTTEKVSPSLLYSYSSDNVYIKSKSIISNNRIPDLVYFDKDKFGNIGNNSNKFNYLTDGLKNIFVLWPYDNAEITFFYNQLFESYYGDCRNIYELRMAREKYLNGFSAKDGPRSNFNELLKCDGKSLQRSFPLIQAESDVEMRRKLDFVSKNIDEKQLQILDRYYFHEVPFVLSPINEIRLGKPLKEVFSQYGYLSIMAVSAGMDALGGFSFPNYEKIVKASYLIYYIIFVATVILIFKQPVVRASLILIYSFGFFSNTYHFYQYPPGHAPLRHFFDLIILICAWRFDRDRGIFYFILGGIFVVLSIFTDKDYGMLVAAAFLAAGAYYCVYLWFEGGAGRKKFLSALSVVAVASIVALKIYPLAPNPSSLYFLDGFYSFAVPRTAFSIVLLSILLQALVVLVWGRSLFRLGRLFIFLFASFYSQLLYFYFVWGGGNAHFFTLISLYVLPYMLLLDQVDWQKNLLRRLVAGLGLILCMMMVFNRGIVFIKDGLQSQKVFNDHIIHRWEIPRAKGMITTIDPGLFSESVEKIRRYVPDKKIAMISKYDSVLSILAEKYSSLPFFELRSMTVTQDDYRLVKEKLQSSNIIFVDNDIDRDFEAEMNRMNFWNMLPSFFAEHREQRIPKLKVLRQLFIDVVKNNYELIDKGQLISVYRRK